jgi:HlyD family secretion protein
VLNNLPHVLRVPSEALFNNNQVWTLDADSKLRKRELQLGIGNFTYTEVRGGLKEGELLVRSPDQPGLVDGARATTKAE